MPPAHYRTATPERQARQDAARAALKARPQLEDPLKRRARSAAYWKGDACHGLNHSRTFYRHPGFQRFLMPGVRAHLKAKADAQRNAYLAGLRAEGQRIAYEKALKKAGPLPLFDLPE